MRAPFFVVTTGRSGSLSLALTLSQHPYICALHEPLRRLIVMAHHKMTGQSPADAGEGLVRWFRYHTPIPAGPQLCGLVDHKLTHFIPELAEAFQDARFIWLTRDGRKVVRSIMSRGWYTEEERVKDGNIWQNYRIPGFICESVEEETWLDMSQFERCCWYWGWMQRSIAEDLLDVDDLGRWTLFPIEEGQEMLVGLQRWLEMEPVPLTMWRANVGPPTVPVEWTGEQDLIFEKWCGAEMDRAYKGWRENDA